MCSQEWLNLYSCDHCDSILFQFQPKKKDEAESESDWDSLPGDVPDPSSSPEVTPRHQPAPPPGSPKGNVPHAQKRPQVKSQAAVVTPGKTSVTNSPATQPRAKPATPSSQMPSQLYGKPGVTNFVDRSLSATAFNDGGLESRQNKEIHPDINENRLQQGSQGRDDGIHIEMNEVDYHQRNPPFTNFQGTVYVKSVFTDFEIVA